MSGRVDFSAGIRPATMAVRMDATTVNASTRASSRRSSDTAIGSGSSMVVSARISHHARPMPTAAPAAASNRLSISNCCTRRPRPAPSARRTLISRARAAPRASSMPATFAHAISRTRPTATMQPVTITESIPSASGWTRVALAARTVTLRPLLVSGYSRASCAAATCMLARA